MLDPQPARSPRPAHAPDRSRSLLRSRFLTGLALASGVALVVVAGRVSGWIGPFGAEPASAAVFMPRLGEAPFAAELRSAAFFGDVAPERIVRGQTPPRVMLDLPPTNGAEPGSDWSVIAWSPPPAGAALLLASLGGAAQIAPLSAPRAGQTPSAPGLTPQFALHLERPLLTPPARPLRLTAGPEATSPEAVGALSASIHPRPRPERAPEAILLASLEPSSLSRASDAGAAIAPLEAALAESLAPAALPAPASSLLPRGRPATLAALARPSAPAESAARPGFSAAIAEAMTGTAAGSCPAQLTRGIPRRSDRASGGQAALGRLTGASGTARDAAILRELEAGNLPEHLRRLVAVEMAGTDARGQRTRITLCVMPDYLALGSDRDFVRVPMGLPAANRIAARFGMLLPTAHMVDAIHRAAQVRLSPSPMPPGAEMSSTAYLVRHNATVERQRGGRALGLLVSGHKKDLVLSNRLGRVAGRVAIYGWHQANGRPIQPLSTVHGANYADYSHGIRLVSQTAYLNGRAVDLQDLLGDPRYAGILSGEEGPLAVRRLIASL